MNVWRPKAGELIQIWDRVKLDPNDPTDARIRDHGELAYIVRESKKTDTFTDDNGKSRVLTHIIGGDVFKCILFGPGDSIQTCHVHYENMRQPKPSK